MTHMDREAERKKIRVFVLHQVFFTKFLPKGAFKAVYNVWA